MDEMSESKETKSALDRAVTLILILELAPANLKKQMVYKALAEQDKITRRACVESACNIDTYEEIDERYESIIRSDVVAKIMNTKAV